MEQLLPQYRPVDFSTWIYLSSILTIAVYFKFNRVWSLRNLDLMALIAMSPGLLLAEKPGASQFWGFCWLFAIGGFWLVRLLVDPMMVRRPLLEPNMTTGGLTCIGVALLLFLMTNVMMKPVTDADLDGPRQVRALLERSDSPTNLESLAKHGPGYPFLHILPSISMQPLVEPAEVDREETSRDLADAATARTMAIICHVAIVLAMTLIGIRHFDNIRTGIAAATLYLMLPYTAEMTGRVEHVLPAALLIWAVAAYRRPLIAGMLIGLAIGVTYYPVFLLPLWCSFYWRRGLLRFCIGTAITLAVLVSTLALTSADMASFLAKTQAMFGFTSLSLEGVQGFWGFKESTGPYRLPVVVACVLLSLSFVFWPVQKNLGTLLSCSAAVMLSTQFWHAQGGGLYMAWYLPMMLMTIFRPNLEDRIALSTLGDGWWIRRRLQLRSRAA
ncbi:MAG TPA: hypothetical protein VG713_02810 [Pirellulales bacterium]|nr:hypothetical protein [Pirellulales bacterium]